MGMSRMGANLCGGFSLLCGLPFLTLVLMAGRVQYFPDWMFAILLFSIFWSPLAGSLLALAAARANRWWFVLAAVWLTVFVYSLWYDSKHPFDM